MPLYRRRLPHIQPAGYPLFITFRLYGSIPTAKRDLFLKSDPRPGYAFVAADRELDRAAAGPRWLGDSRIAALVADVIVSGEKARNFYELHAWVVMPNHVHLLITCKAEPSSILRWLKSSTAHKANIILGLSGQPFWREEFWDRWMRSTDEFNKTRRYIEFNPVSVGFVESPELWRWSSAGWAGASAHPT